MRDCSFLILCLVLFFLSLPLGDPARGNNEIFPAVPAAQSSDHWENGYFVLNGKPVFINSGSIHYARVPRELWRDRIWRLKMMGFNCAQSYVFWNATEPKKGVFDFTDNLDLDAWLSLLQEMGMYALVRPGPYACAEWEEGGYPSWLNADPGMIQREMGPSLLYADPYLKLVYGIIAKHQVNHAGNVFLVQIENEHRPEWGTEATDPYLKYLDDQARADGIEVPMFNSGLHHSNEPAGETPFPVGTSPWYSTEFWTQYFNFYGEMKPAALAEKTRGAWKAAAFGGAGYNFYMAHGGTNFGYSGDSLEAAYDFAAPIGQAGQLREFYFTARRAAYFDQTFVALLTGSHNDPTFATCDQPDLRVTTRTNPTGGSIIFVDHFLRNAKSGGAAKQDAPADTTVLQTHLSVGGMPLPHQGTLAVRSLEPSTLLVHFPWTANATFESVCTNVLFRQTFGTIDYWVCYGSAGDSGEVTLARKSPASGPAQVDFTYPEGDAITEVDLDSGDGRQARLLVINSEMTKRAWLAHDKIYIGPSFVLEDGSMEFSTTGGKATIYAASGKSEVAQAPAQLPDLPALAPWTWKDAAPERAVDFNTKEWLSSEGPQPMENYDDFENRYGWYRTTVHANTAGPVSLHFSGMAGKVVPYLNGQLGDLAQLNLKAGDNSLAILVKAGPRPKGMAYYTEPIGTRRSRGVWGGVSMDPTATMPPVDWKMKAEPANDDALVDLSKPDYDDSAWQAVEVNKKIILGKGVTFRGTFDLTADQIDSSLEFPAMGNQTVLYLNGQKLIDRTQDVSKILKAGKNTLVVQAEAGRPTDMGSPSLALWHNSPLTHAQWYFHGGLDDLQETAIVGRVTNWDDFLSHAPWQTGLPTVASQPTFWKSTFTYHPMNGTKETIGLETTGLTAGHVWLNGHNLGECPQKVLMYLPECWLKDGANDLVVFDLAGANPDQVGLSRYESFALAAPK
jgi:beta-galactosidase